MLKEESYIKRIHNSFCNRSQKKQRGIYRDRADQWLPGPRGWEGWTAKELEHALGATERFNVTMVVTVTLVYTLVPTIVEI